MTERLHNPKLEDYPAPNAEKDPTDRVSGYEPMTGAQASYLTTLSEKAGEPAPIGDLTKAEASQHIDGLKARLGRD